MKKKILVFILTVCAVLSVTSCDGIHFHEYSEATCDDPKICECGETKGEALGHDFTQKNCKEYQVCRRCGEKGDIAAHEYEDATCTVPLKCKNCGATKGEPLGHIYNDEGSCTEPQHCSRCGEASGIILGHTYSDATCTISSKCTKCGEMGENALGHDYTPATCTSSQICKRCQSTTGSPLGHNYSEATCLSAQKCKTCGKTSGSPLGHTYSDGKCIRCNSVDPNSLPVALKEVYVVDSYRYEYKTDSVTDSYGNIYMSGVHCYNSCQDEIVYSIHNLNGGFKRFSGYFVVGDNTPGDKVFEIRIYIDGKQVWSKTNIDKFTKKMNVSIDCQAGSLLKIEIRHTGGIYWDIPNIYLVDANLEKK